MGTQITRSDDCPGQGVTPAPTGLAGVVPTQEVKLIFVLNNRQKPNQTKPPNTGDNSTERPHAPSSDVIVSHFLTGFFLLHHLTSSDKQKSPVSLSEV